MTLKNFFSFSILTLLPSIGSIAQQKLNGDSVIKRIIYKDTIIYRQVFKHDTIRIRHYIFSDTLKSSGSAIVKVNTNEPRKKKLINPNNWGIGPSVGAYYSPYNGFDVNIGFGIQYYMLAIPSFRNPHLGHRKKK